MVNCTTNTATNNNSEKCARQKRVAKILERSCQRDDQAAKTF